MELGTLQKQQFFVEIGHYQKCKQNQQICGDTFLSRFAQSENRFIAVLSDGLGSGIKAKVLSNMTASMALNFRLKHEPMERAALSIMNTLPTDKQRNISYSTFSIIDIDFDGESQLVEYGNPQAIVYRNNSVLEIQRKSIKLKQDKNKRHFYVSRFRLQKEDRLLLYSDGLSQSGIGSTEMPFGWGDDRIEKSLAHLINNNSRISAYEISKSLVLKAEKNDLYRPKDDISCVAIYLREPRKLLLCSGPPFKAIKDRYLSEIVKAYHGKIIICGGTTSMIISRELKRSIEVNIEADIKGLPPISHMQGVDMLTEGILTLGKVSEILNHLEDHDLQGDGPAEEVARKLLESDVIDFMVGTKINEAHQDPSLPIELEIRRNVIKKIAHLLENKFLKKVNLTYL